MTEVVTVGRVVHVIIAGGQHRPAIVVATEVDGIVDRIEVAVFYSWTDIQTHPRDWRGIDFKAPAANAERWTADAFTWHWPERMAGMKPPAVEVENEIDPSIGFVPRVGEP